MAYLCAVGVPARIDGETNPEYHKIYHSLNKEKHVKKASRWNRENKEKRYKTCKKHILCKKYNITPEEYDNLIKSQNGNCKICGRKNTDGRSLHVDHCHINGKVRGLLCFRCNSLLGSANDSIERLESAIKYLNESRR